jgi:hemolysin activation/secretion protein
MKKIILFLIVFSPIFSVAQSPVNPGRYLEEIQRRQQQEQQDILRQREVESAKKAQEASVAADIAQEEESEEIDSCVEIKKVIVYGIKRISRSKLKKAVKTLQKPCMNKKDLQDIQSTVQKMYVDKGYISARVYFNFSRIKENILSLSADEGFLEDILMEDQNGKQQKGFWKKLQLFDAFPLQKGKVLNLRNIEQGLDQMNKLQSNNVTMEVRPGDKEGGSVVLIKNQKGNATQITAGYDNAGQDNTGRYKGNISLSQDNLISLNDNFFVNASSTLWNNRDLRYSNSYTASLRIPLGYWTFSDSVSYSEYLTTSQGAETSFQSAGTSASNNFNIERMMFRGTSYKLTLGAQLAAKDSKNYLEDVYLDTSSRLLTVGSAYLSGTYYSKLGSFFGKLSYNKGLDIFGSEKDKDIMSGKPRAQFDSWNFYLNYSKDFWKINYTLNFDSQYTDNDLFASEQMLIGGEGTIRGFRDNSLSGEKGFYVRNDFRLSAHSIIGDSRNPWMTDFFQKTYFGVFADYGYVKPQTFGESGTLAGAGAKISYYGKYISGNFAYAKSLHMSSDMEKEGNIFYLNTALNLSF